MNELVISKERREILGFHINRRRRVRELLIDELSLVIGVNRAYLKGLEDGKISVVNPMVLMKLSNALGIHYLMLYMLAGYLETYDLVDALERIHERPTIIGYVDI